MKVRTIEELAGTLQLVSRQKPRKTIYTRAAPVTMINPTNAQLETRIRFAEAAKKARGLKGLCPTCALPWAACLVKREMSGHEITQKKAKIPRWVERYMKLQESVQLIQRAMQQARELERKI